MTARDAEFPTSVLAERVPESVPRETACPPAAAELTVPSGHLGACASAPVPTSPCPLRAHGVPTAEGGGGE